MLQKGEKTMLQNTRTNRLAAAQVEYTQRGELLVPQHSGAVHVQSGVTSLSQRRTEQPW